jgi:cytochrome P450
MFGGGTDTSAITVEWALAELVANQDRLKLVEAEVDRVVGHGNAVEISDLTKMPYLGAVVKETMRLHPVIPLLISHRATQSCEVDGYAVVEGTQVMVNVWAIGRDPDVWENPLQFLPERFMDGHSDNNNNNSALHGQSFGFLPFGSGRRICPAWKLGFLSVQLILANLIRQIDLRQSTAPKLVESYGGVVSALHTPLIIKAHPRLPAHSLLQI